LKNENCRLARRFRAAACNLKSAICHLPSAICHLPSAIALLVALCCASLSPAAEPAWDYAPYRVQVLVVFPYEAEFVPAGQAAWCEDVGGRLAALQGAAWEVKVAAAPPALTRQAAAGLDRLPAAALPPEALAGDKAFVAAIGGSAAARRIAVREFDVRTQLWGPVVERTAGPGKLVAAAVDAVLAAFAPLARVVAVEEEGVVLRLRAGQLRPADGDLEPLKPGDAFRPVVRLTDAEGQLRQAAVVPWTAIVVEEAAAGEARGRVLSGVPKPFAATRGTGLERLAIRAVSSGQPTTLRLLGREASPPASSPAPTETPAAEGSPAEAPPATAAAAARQPLAGYEVFDLGAGGQRRLLGCTDRAGRLRIAAGPSAVRLLAIRSGGATLARLPLLPGGEPEVTIELPHGDAALATEAYLANLRDAVLELAARQQLLIVRARAAASAKQLAEAEKLLDEIRKLPPAKEALEALVQRHGRPSADDPDAAKKLAAWLEESQEALASQVDAKALKPLEDQIQRLKPKPPKPPTPAEGEPPTEGAAAEPPANP